MKRIETMEELRALPSGTVVDVQTGEPACPRGHTTCHYYCVVNWDKDCADKHELTQSKQEGVLNVGRWSMSFRKGMFGVWTADAMEEDEAMLVVMANSEHKDCSVFVLEAEDLRMFINRVGHAVARVKAIAADFWRME